MEKKLTNVSIKFKNTKLSYDDIKHILQQTYKDEYIDRIFSKNRSTFYLSESISTSSNIKLATPFITYYFMRLISEELFNFKFLQLEATYENGDTDIIKKPKKFFTTHTPEIDEYSVYASQFENIISDCSVNNNKVEIQDTDKIFECNEGCSIKMKFTTKLDKNQFEITLKNYFDQNLNITEEITGNTSYFVITEHLDKMLSITNTKFYYFYRLVYEKKLTFKLVNIGWKTDKLKRYKWKKQYIDQIFPNDKDNGYHQFLKHMNSIHGKTSQKRDNKPIVLQATFTTKNTVDELLSTCDKLIVNNAYYKIIDTPDNNIKLTIEYPKNKTLNQITLNPFLYLIKNDFKLIQCSIKEPGKSKYETNLDDLKLNDETIYTALLEDLTIKPEENMNKSEDNSLKVEITEDISDETPITLNLEANYSKHRILDLSNKSINLIINTGLINEYIQNCIDKTNTKPTAIILPQFNELQQTPVMYKSK